jgi:hypothetical protein
MAITVIYVYPHLAMMEWFVNQKTVHNTNVKYKKKNESNTTDGYNKKLYMSFSRKRDSIYGSIKWNEW